MNIMREKLLSAAKELAAKKTQELQKRAAEARQARDYRTARAVDRVVLQWQNVGR